MKPLPPEGARSTEPGGIGPEGRARTISGTARGLDFLGRLQPVHVGLIALVAALVYVVARTIVAGHGNVGALIVLGHTFVRPTRATAGTPIRPGNGYDGQFYFRMALGPTDWSRQAFGITLDSLGRLSRIGYPALVWLLALGNHSAVPLAMVAVNVIAFAVLATAASVLARHVGRSPAWGLAVASFSGFSWAIGRDLTEITEAALFTVALVGLRKGRPILAGAALGAAALTREPALILAGALVLTRAFSANPRLRTRLRLERPPWARARFADAAWLIPLTSFGAWQLAIWAGTGVLPVATSSGANIGAPFAGLVRAAAHYARSLPHVPALLWSSELAVLFALSLGGGVAIYRRALPLPEALTWAALVATAVCLGNGIWSGDVGFPSLDDLWLLGCIAVLSTRWSLRWAAGVAAATWTVVTVELVRFI